jgi:hypothetical protein
MNQRLFYRGSGREIIAVLQYYITLWLVKIALCVLGALVTAKKSRRSKPMLLATVGFAVIMIGAFISLTGDGIARYVRVGPDFEDIFYLLTNVWTVADLGGLALIVLGILFSFGEGKSRNG